MIEGGLITFPLYNEYHFDFFLKILMEKNKISQQRKMLDVMKLVILLKTSSSNLSQSFEKARNKEFTVYLFSFHGKIV